MTSPKPLSCASGNHDCHIATQHPKNQPPQNRLNPGDSVSQLQDNHDDINLDPSRRGARGRETVDGSRQPPFDTSQYPPGNYIDDDGLFVGREIIMDRISQMIQQLSSETNALSTLPASPSSLEEAKILLDAKEQQRQQQAKDTVAILKSIHKPNARTTAGTDVLAAFQTCQSFFSEFLLTPPPSPQPAKTWAQVASPALPPPKPISQTTPKAPEITIKIANAKERDEITKLS